MKKFYYKNDYLFCDEVKISEILKKIKTPFYLYSKNNIKDNISVLKNAFNYAELHYAMKANSNRNILKIINEENCGLDVVSAGEIYRGLKAGVLPSDIIYSGVGKTDFDIEYALKNKIFSFNVESASELKNINRISNKLKTIANIGIRMNPDVNPHTHHHIATGLKNSKFGIDEKEIIDLYKFAKKLSNIKISGISIHIGSQIMSFAPYLEAVNKLKNKIKELKNIGIKLQYIDIGGGFGISYEGNADMKVQELANKLKNLLLSEDNEYKIIIEPGRFIVGHSGAIISKIQYIKKKNGKNFIILDSAMNDLIRPAFYDAFHNIIPVNKKSNKKIKADVVGPVCESGDFFAKDRNVFNVSEGDYLPILDAGAYGMTMASNYNSRPRLAEVMVDNKEVFIIRKQESFDEFIKLEKDKLKI